MVEVDLFDQAQEAVRALVDHAAAELDLEGAPTVVGQLHHGVDLDAVADQRHTHGWTLTGATMVVLHSLARNHALVDGNKRLAWPGSRPWCSST